MLLFPVGLASKPNSIQLQAQDSRHLNHKVLTRINVVRGLEVFAETRRLGS